MELKADFIADWTAHLRAELVACWGPSEISDIDDRVVPEFYFDTQHRRIAMRPRALRVAKEFVCQEDLLAGWELLEQKVLAGENLNPHLSKRHAAIDNQDGLLADWDVHHFHLGTVPDQKNPWYAERTDPVLFARVTANDFYVVGTFPHAGGFEETDVIERLHVNWAESIAPYRINGVAGQCLTGEQRRALRKKNLNVYYPTEDGTVYMPIGFGIACSGHRVASALRADAKRMELRRLQRDIAANTHLMLPRLRQVGYTDGTELEAHYVVTKDGSEEIQFPKFPVVDLTIDRNEAPLTP